MGRITDGERDMAKEVQKDLINEFKSTLHELRLAVDSVLKESLLVPPGTSREEVVMIAKKQFSECFDEIDGRFRKLTGYLEKESCS